MAAERAGRPDRGSATVLAVAATGVVLVVMVAGLVLGAVVSAARRAAAAADLAALAGAVAHARGHDGSAACARATAIAAANRAGLERCAVAADDSVHVTATARVGGVTGWVGMGVPDVVRARARAGPEPGGWEEGGQPP